MARRLQNRFWDYIKAATFIAVVTIAAGLLGRFSMERYDGMPVVIDGDSIRLDGVEMRLLGIDAPELSQTCNQKGEWTCGRSARDHLRGLLTGVDAHCSGFQKDRYERVLVHCTVGDIDINAAMVRDGYAVSFGAYEGLEAQARAGKRGIWDSKFQRPAQWRDARRSDAAFETEHVIGLMRSLQSRLTAWWHADD